MLLLLNDLFFFFELISVCSRLYASSGLNNLKIILQLELLLLRLLLVFQEQLQQPELPLFLLLQLLALQQVQQLQQLVLLLLFL